MARIVHLKGDEDDEEALEAINRVIGTMTHYGRKSYPFPRGRRAYVVEWSNGYASWCPPGYYNVNSPYSIYKRIGELSLDANELMVVGLSRQRLDSLVLLFDPLPLFSGSHEARERGNFSLVDIDAPPAIREIAIEETVGREEDGPRFSKYLEN